MTTEKQIVNRTKEAAKLAAVPVPGFLGYFVDRKGVVYSGRQRTDTLPLRRLRPGKHGGDYPAYRLCKGSHAVTLTAHRIVALTFLPSRPSSNHGIRHLDGDPNNNSVENLAWGTQAENIQDKIRHGTVARGERNGRKLHPESYPVGEEWPQTVLTENDVRQILKRLAAGELGVRLAREFGVVKTTISAIKNGHTWRHLPRIERASAEALAAEHGRRVLETSIEDLAAEVERARRAQEAQR